MLLKNRILFYASAFFLITIFIISVIIGLYLRNQNIINTEKTYFSTINNTSEIISSGISKNITLVNALSQNLSSLSVPNNKITYDSEILTQYLVETIEQNKQIRDFFIIIEPDIIIQKDSLDKYLFDQKGRFMPHWKKNSKDQVSLHTFDIEKNSVFYKTTKTNLKTTVLEPYIQRNAGKSILKLPIITPITYGNKFIGVVGIEISLNWIYDEITTTDFSEGDLLVLTNSGNIVAVSNKQHFVGKFITDYFSTDVNTIFFDLKHDKPIQKTFSNNKFFTNLFYIDQTNVSWQLGAYISKRELKQKANVIFFISILVGFLVSFLILLVLWFLLSAITKPLKKIELLTEKLFRGELESKEDVKIKSKEVKNINQNLFNLQRRLNELVNINYKIAHRDYTKFLDDNGNENDMLAKSINYSINEIVKRWKTREIVEENKEKTKWISDGITQIQVAVRIGDRSIEEISDNIIKTLAKYLDAYLAGFFLYNDNNKDDIFLTALSTYAYENKKSYNKIIRLREGLIGTVAVEKKQIYLEKIPSDYKHILSGLGESKPKSILLLPLIYEDEFLGVIELAFLKKFTPIKKEFIDKAIEHITLSIKTINTNISTTKLLQKSQKQTQELEKTHKLLESNLEEVKKSQKKAQVREAEMNGILNAVNNTILTVEYTTEGILLDANKKFLETMYFELKDLKGLNVLDLVKTEREELEEVIRRVSNGEFVEKLMKRFTKYGEERWLFSTYTPFYNVDNEITKILYFAVDITENKLHSESLEAQIEQLKNYKL